MLQPEPMRRVIILTSRDDARELIEALHAAHAAHVIEHRAGADELPIGRPLPEGSGASERLVRVRSLLRHLDAEDHKPTRTFTTSEIDERLDALLDDLEEKVGETTDTLADLEAEAAEKETHRARLQPLSRLPLELQDYRGYETLAVFAGEADSDPTKDVGESSGHLAEVFYDAKTGTTACFTTLDQREEVQKALLQHGFREMEVPPGEGRPEARARALMGEMEALTARANESRAHLHRLKADHADLLRAAEEHLEVEVQKAEAPLNWGATDNTFILEAWVPESDVPTLESALTGALGDRIHVEWLGTADAHALEEGHGADEIHGEAGHEEPATEDLPPTKLAHGGFSRNFEFFTNMFSTPKYGEVDPTTVLAIAFPLFFGFMIGDLGLGLLMVLLGWVMIRKLGKVEGVRELGFALAIAGLVAALVGGFVFADAFGIPLVTNEHMEHELHDHGLTLIDSNVGKMKDGHAITALASCQDVYKHVHEPTWTCMLTGSPGAPVELHMGGGDVPYPFILKTFDLNIMLMLSVFAGLVHLAVGLLFGVKNEIAHDVKHAIAKVGWLILLAGFFFISVALLLPEGLHHTAYEGGPVDAFLVNVAHVGFTWGGGLAAVAAVVLFVTEGGLAIIELPSMLSNLLSYLRLGAVAIGKGAMAVAFNALTLVPALMAENVGLIVGGLIAFIIAQALLFVLGLLSAGIQAIRLNYVEFFTKFYKGGGKPFQPFGHVRQFTTK